MEGERKLWPPAMEKFLDKREAEADKLKEAGDWEKEIIRKIRYRINPEPPLIRLHEIEELEERYRKSNIIDVEVD